MQEWFQQPGALQPLPLTEGLRLGASFNHRKLKVGQWLSRLSIQGVDCLPLRCRIVSIQTTDTGKHFSFRVLGSETLMTVCHNILIQDFRSIVSANGQRCEGEAVTGESGPQQKNKKQNWYEKID